MTSPFSGMGRVTSLDLTNLMGDCWSVVTWKQLTVDQVSLQLVTKLTKSTFCFQADGASYGVGMVNGVFTIHLLFLSDTALYTISIHM